MLHVKRTPLRQSPPAYYGQSILLFAGHGAGHLRELGCNPQEIRHIVDCREAKDSGLSVAADKRRLSRRRLS